MKKGLSGNTVGSVLYDQQSKQNWSLCVGAGISCPIFPSWRDLAEGLIKSTTTSISNADTKSLVTDFKPDALIQAVFNRLNLEEDEYIEKLSCELFKNTELGVYA